jgi:hypothetical protein
MRTPKDCLGIAISARGIAAQLTEPEAKQMMEDVADEWERIAQEIGTLTAFPSRDD